MDMKQLLLAFILMGTPAASWGFLNPPQFIALMPPGANEVLERENQIDTLCPPKAADHEKCRTEKLKPQSWNLNVYQDKSASSKKLGVIVITATPGKGVKAIYTDAAKKSVPLESDTGAGDWGYSSYFEFGLNNAQGDWLQLPKRPFPTPVWINLKAEWPTKNKPGEVIKEIFPTADKMETGTPYTAGKLGSIVITQFSGQNFSFRKENPNDMLCGEEPVKVPASDLKTTTKPIGDLFDGDGHLIAWTTHSRGC
jgi:hypothetical protein